MKNEIPSAKHQEVFLQAQFLHKNGRLNEAAEHYKILLIDFPNNPMFICALGTIALQNGQLEAGIRLLDKSLSLDTNQINALFNRGIALMNLNRFEEAVSNYDNLLAIQSNYPEAHNNRGNALQELKNFTAAVASYDNPIRFNSNYAEAYNNRASAYKNLKIYPAALADFDQAITLKPDYAEAYNNRGLVWQDIKNYSSAIADFQQAIQLNNYYAEAYYNQANVLQSLKKYSEALLCYEKALSIRSDYVEVYNNKGNVQKELQQFDAAIKSFEQALAIKPNYPEVYNNIGTVFKETKQFDIAIEYYDKAINLKPDYAEAFNNRGLANQELKKFKQAISDYDRALNLKADSDFLYGQRLQVKLQICDWKNIKHLINELLQKIKNGEPATNPFTMLAVIDDPAIHKKTAEIGISVKFPAQNRLPKLSAYHAHKKLKIAYFSADFRNHAVAILTAELFKKHDRSKFEIIAIAFGPDVKDEMRTRLEASFDKYIDIRKLSDIEAAMLIRNMEIDIAVDLGGHTNDSRTGIFALRAAPVQVSYIGYLGTIGAEYMDYLIADQIIIPEDAKKHYVEKIVYLPSYQVNDTKRQIAEPGLTRGQLGLPENVFVFCCFNNTYKISPDTFYCWLRILNQVKDSILLLYAENELAEINLKQNALDAGFDIRRLYFGKALPAPDYLARYQQVDLFLDTLPYNAGTTASDALWAGLPVLTQMGVSFPSRVAASILHAIQLPELITSSAAEYEQKAIYLATNPDKLAAIKQKLVINRLTTPLFDIDLFTTHIETAFLKMYELSQSGRPPEDIYISNKAH